MLHQDLKLVFLTNKSNTIVKKETTKVLRTKINNPIAPGVKLDENDEVREIKLVPKEIGNEITQARNLKHMTQKKLALELNLKTDVISNIESGKAIYNKEQIARIRRKLGLIR